MQAEHLQVGDTKGHPAQYCVDSMQYCQVFISPMIGAEFEAESAPVQDNSIPLFVIER